MTIEIRNTTGQVVEVNDGTGEYRVLCEEQLQRYTMEGWEVVAMVVADFYLSTPVPRVAQMRFLVRRGHDIVYAELRDAKIAAEHECSKAQLELVKVKDKLEAKQLAISAYEAEAEEANAQAVAVLSAHSQLVVKLKKMESEMAKVRTAIGDKAWKEFVEGDG